MKLRSVHLFACVSLALGIQNAAADAESAATLARRTENKVYRASIKPRWLSGGKSLWYRVQTGSQSHEFVSINAETGERRTATDLHALDIPGEDIKTSDLKVNPRPTRFTGAESGIRFVNKLKTAVDLIWIDLQGEHVRYGSVRAEGDRDQHTYEGHVWLISSPTGEPLAVIEAKATIQTIIIDGQGAKVEDTKRPEPPKKNEGTSPNGKWSAFVENDIVMLRDLATNKTTVLNTDLNGKLPFRGAVKWAPDSTTFVVSNCANTPVRRVGFIESTPKGQLQPRLRDFEYAKPGDPLPKPSLILFKLTSDSYHWTRVKADLFPNAFTLSMQIPVQWSEDGSELYFDYNERGHQLYRILAVDAKTAAVRVVVEETSKTFIDYTKKTWRHWLKKSGELLWMSERDGWCHLYLYDVKTGVLNNQVTKGNWPVRSIVHVDEKRREVWFMASGLRTEEDPYHEHLCRVKFDGTEFARLTEADGQHRVEFSPNREFFIATWSRADHPPVSELRRSKDGSLVCVMERAEAQDLQHAGWTMPERFVAKGRDGRTDIHGVIIKPSKFDSSKRYPVVEEIYAGPHSAFTPKEFGRLLRQHQIAELGFIVVQMDGMGTNHRGKAFHDVAWKNLKDSGFPDRIAWIKEAAKSRPWMDLERVGIYGGSAGGQTAMRALIDHHDFYKVAVSDCGCHDNRMDKIWWNEQWMGWPIDDAYARNSNLEDAHKMEGHLLLIVGELDNNVDPASTIQVVGALQRANKSFEFMPIIGTGHGAAETPYGSKLRADYLVKHLRP